MTETIFSTQQTIALDAIASGASVNQAAAAAGVHRNTIANWRRETVNFEIALNNAHYDRALSLREKAEELTDLAFATIRGILEDPNASPSVRLKAALAIANLVTTQMPPRKKPPVTLDEALLGAAAVPAPNPVSLHKMHNADQPAAVQTIRRDHPKVGRNEACPCGSGLKHKRCCLDKVPPVHLNQDQ